MPLNSAGKYSMNPQVGAAMAKGTPPAPPADPMAGGGDMTIHPNGDGTFQITDASGAPMDVPDVQTLCDHIEQMFGGGQEPEGAAEPAVGEGY